jgi:hypothetical protein
MQFNVYAMGYFESNFTSKPYLFSSQYVAIQSANRYAKNALQDDLYRRFIAKHKQILAYVPKTQKPHSNSNKDSGYRLIQDLTE